MCHVLDQANDLSAIAKLVVVPYIQHDILAVNNGGLAIDNAAMTVANEIRRHHFRRIDEVDLTPQL